MNKKVGKFLLGVDKFMPEMNLLQPGYTYSACGSFTKNEYKNLKKQKNIYIYQNKEHMVYREFNRDLTRRKASNKKLHDKAFSRKYDGYQRGFQWSINFLIIKLLVVVLKIKIY